MRVGTSEGGMGGNATDRDHPHACGDKNIFDIKYYADRGSSPCVWGQVARYLPHFLRRRIIPMRVGTRGKFGECW